MRLSAPSTGIDVQSQDIYGQPFKLSDYRGKKVLLCFFRNAGCPFCNFRVYELTNQYKKWKGLNVEVIAFFSSSKDEVREHVAKYPRPFRMIADPDLTFYKQYGVEKSTTAFWKAVFFGIPNLIRGFKTGGFIDRNNRHINLVPADFLIDENGTIQHLWYGRDVSDHMPMSQVLSFINSK